MRARIEELFSFPQLSAIIDKALCFMLVSLIAYQWALLSGNRQADIGENTFPKTI